MRLTIGRLTTGLGLGSTLGLALALGLAGAARADQVVTSPAAAMKASPQEVAAADKAAEKPKAPEIPEGNEAAIPPMLEWSFTGVFGHYDLAQLQRGYQVYKEVCANCHSMKLVSFRNLEDLGYSTEQVKALAATYQVQDINDKGETIKRPGRPADYFPSPFPNDEAAAAAYGKAPPDMSVLAKARGWERGFPAFIFDFFTQAEEAEGPDHIRAVLLGYVKPDDPTFNLYMQNHKIAMPKPLSDGQIEYTDGAPKTVDQYSKDVAAFLMWAAEPKLDQRKAMGFRVMIFLIVFATLLYFVKKRIWSRVKGGEP